MRGYADSSFVVRLVVRDGDSAGAVAEYRRLDYPILFFLPLHRLEVHNAILQRAFHQRRSVSSGQRQHVARERDAALSRLDHFVSRRAMLDVDLDMEEAIIRAGQLSTAYTERLGTRAIDLLHIACALMLKADFFLTADQRQAQLARAEGIKVTSL